MFIEVTGILGIHDVRHTEPASTRRALTDYARAGRIEIGRTRLQSAKPYPARATAPVSAAGTEDG